VLAAVFAMAGVTKLAQSKAKLLGSGSMAWVEDFAERQIKGVGTLEVLAAGGLILLAAFQIAPVLTALAVTASTAGRDSRAKPSFGTPQVAAAATGRCPLRRGPFVVGFKTTLARREP
jgi:hypothetical protein